MFYYKTAHLHVSFHFIHYRPTIYIHMHVCSFHHILIVTGVLYHIKMPEVLFQISLF